MPPIAFRQVFPAMPPAGTVVLPLTNRELLQRYARLFRRARSAFNAPGLVVSAVLNLALLILWWTLWPVSGSAPGVHVGIALSIALWFAGHWFTAGCTSLVFALVAMGRRVVVADVVAELKPVFWRLLGLSALCGVLVPAGLVVGVVPGVLAYGAVALAGPALVLERLTVGQAVARSLELLRGQGWRTFRLLLVTAVSTVVVAVFVPLQVYRTWDLPSDVNPFWVLFTMAVSMALVSGALWAGSGALISMYYVDRYLVVATRPATSPVQQVTTTG
ncbi:MAG: hypothetical protein ABWY11_10800 [Umezawaea sp.]